MSTSLCLNMKTAYQHCQDRHGQASGLWDRMTHDAASLLQDTVPPVFEGFPADITTTCTPEEGGPAALPHVAVVTVRDPNDDFFSPATTFMEQQVGSARQCFSERLCLAVVQGKDATPVSGRKLLRH
jgi:hypothetical protein